LKTLLVVTAAIEVGAGVALVLSPSMFVSLLLGTALDLPAGLVTTRIAGAALLSLAVACWQVRQDAQSRAAMGLVAAMLLYNAAVIAILIHAGILMGLIGIAFWPAVLLHTAMLVWCVTCLRSRWSDPVR
jgi:hypothetical protein